MRVKEDKQQLQHHEKIMTRSLKCQKTSLDIFGCFENLLHELIRGLLSSAETAEEFKIPHSLNT